MLQLTVNGNLGRDPEQREINGKNVARFALAARTGRDETTWVNCTVWGNRAETVLKYMSKGDKITVVGSGRMNEYTTKEGVQRQSLELNVVDFTLPARKDSQESTSLF